MRFLFVAAFRPTVDSGAAGSLLAIGAALQALDHSVDYEWKPAELARVPHPTTHRLLELPRLQLRQVAARLSQAAYDVVIISQPFAYRVYQRLAPRYPRTVFLNRTHGWEARLYHAQQELGFRETRDVGGRLLSPLSAWVTRRACARTARASHGIIAPASRCASYIRREYGLAPERVAVIPYGLSEAARNLAPGTGSHGAGRRMLFVGNYLRRKGSHVLETILPPLAGQFPDATLTLVVDSGSLTRVAARYREAFADRLTVLPWMGRERLEAVYAAHDILLFPSLFEGFGKTWLEGMAAGLCVVGFAEGGLPDLATHGEHAWFCPPGDLATMSDLLRRALAQPAQAAQLGRRARQRVREYTWERTAQETVEYCRRLGAR